MYNLANTLSVGLSLKRCKIIEGIVGSWVRLSRTIEWDAAVTFNAAEKPKYGKLNLDRKAILLSG